MPISTVPGAGMSSSLGFPRMGQLPRAPGAQAVPQQPQPGMMHTMVQPPANPLAAATGPGAAAAEGMMHTMGAPAATGMPVVPQPGAQARDVDRERGDGDRSADRGQRRFDHMQDLIARKGARPGFLDMIEQRIGQMQERFPGQDWASLLASLGQAPAPAPAVPGQSGIIPNHPVRVI